MFYLISNYTFVTILFCRDFTTVANNSFQSLSTYYRWSCNNSSSAGSAQYRRLKLY